MKKVILFSGVMLFTVAGAAFTVYQSIFQQLNIDEQEAKEYVYRNLLESQVSVPGNTSALKKLTPAQRKEAVTQIGAFLRSYVNSAAFAKQYNEERESNKPASPADAQAKINAEIASTKASIAQMEKDGKDATGNAKKLADATLKLLREKLKALQDPKDPNYALYTTSVIGIDNLDEATYQKQLKKFEKDYPPTPKALAKQRIQEFLALTADIDFDAKLVQDGDVKKFADPKLEAKSYEWKRCFRCGREAITAARAFAQQWLKEL